MGGIRYRDEADRTARRKATWKRGSKKRVETPEAVEKKRAYERAYWHDPKNLARKKRRLAEQHVAKYGMKLAHYNALVAAQNDRCAVCGKGPDGRYKKLCIDHNHETGVVRALLCNSCNVAIGLLKDSPELVQSALDYLKAHGGDNRGRN